MIDENTIKRVMEYHEDQDAVRDRLHKVYIRAGRPNLTKIAWGMGISPITLNGFLKGNRKVELRILWAIDCWVREQEALEQK